MNKNNHAPRGWRSYTTNVPLPAIRIKASDLKRLYKIINDRAIQYRDRVLSHLGQLPNEPLAELERRQENVLQAFVTSVTITGMNGESTYGNDEAFFEEGNLPEQIKSVLFTTQTGPQITLNHIPMCRIAVYLDFDRPPLFSLTRSSNQSTPNNSNYEIIADDENWFSAVKAELHEFFSSRESGINWLHHPLTYDVLSLFLAIPLAIWINYRIGVLLTSKEKISEVILAVIFIYVFILLLYCFRLLLSYSRWVFPKVEIANKIKQPALQSRGAWIAITGGFFVAFLYSIGKAIFLQ
jgi:hypothetical protein